MRNKTTGPISVSPLRLCGSNTLVSRRMTWELNMVEKCKYWKFSIMGVEHGEIREMG
jgi:hypothetical protein